MSRVSDDSVAGIGAAVPLLLTAISVMSSFASPGVMIFGQALVTNNHRRVSSVFFTMLKTTAVIGISLFFTMILLSQYFGDIIGFKGEAAEASRLYLLWISPIFLTEILFSNFNAFILGHQKTKVAMWAAFSSVSTNLCLNGLLFYGLLPGWSLGPREVALTTVLAQVAPILVKGWFIFVHLAFRFDSQSQLEEDLNYAKKVLKKVSAPGTFVPMSYNISQIAVFALIGAVSGTLGAASYTYGKNLMLLLSWAGAYSIGMGTQILVSQYQGREHYQSATNRVKVSLLFYLPVVFLFGGLFYVFHVEIAGYLSKQSELPKQLGLMLLFMMCSESFRAGNYIVYPTLRGSGDVNAPVLVSLLSNWILGVGLAWFLGIVLGYGVTGVLVGVLFDEMMRFGFNCYRWFSGRWVIYFKNLKNAEAS